MPSSPDYRLLDAIADPIFIVDREWRYVHHNAATARYSRLTLECLAGRSLWECYPELVGTDIERAYRKAMDERVRVELDAMASAGSGNWFAVTATPYADGLLVHVRDITDERRGVIELRENERKLRQLLEQATDAIYIFDGDGRFRTANDMASAQLGYSREQLAGMTIADVLAPGELERQPLDRAALASGDVVRRVRRFRRSDGSTFPADINSRRLSEEPELLFLAIARDITERQRATDALAESQAMLEATEELAGVGSWAVDVNTGQVAWSEEMFRIFGIDRAAVSPNVRIFFQRIHPSDRKKVRAALKQVLADGVSRSLEWRFVRAEGSVGTIQARARVHRDESGRVDRVLGSAQDVTERVEVEGALRRAHQLLATMIEDAPLAVVTVDADYRVTSWNAAAEHIFGYSTAEIVGQPLPVVPDDRTMELPRMRQNDEENGFTSVPYETVRRRKDGALVDVQIATAALHDARGMIVGGVAFISDLTERNEARRALREREEQHRVVTDSLPVLIAYVDRDERYRFVNQTYTRMLDLDEADVLGKRLGDVLPPPAYAVIEPHVRAALAGELQHFGNEVHAGGATRYMDTSYLPHRDAAGSVVGMYAILTDATERRDLEEQLRQSQKMEAVGRLAGGVAHDFNNLLTVVNVHCEMLLATLADASPLRADIDAIQQAGRKAAALTRQLLAFSRRQVFTLEVFALNAVVTEVEKMFRRVIGENIQIETHLDPAAGAVRADRAQLTQVLMNLVVNARDAMPDGGSILIATVPATLLPGEARARQAAAGDYIRLSVRDTGQGMDAATAARVFEPFFTTKGPGKGTGLGLSTVYGIVKQLEGLIEVTSSVGEGTTFTILLPRARTGQPAGMPAAPVETPRGSEVVLLVEDDDSVRRVARRSLEARGYAVLEAATAGEALVHAREHGETISLLLTDVVMPGMSGPALAESLRALLPEVGVLFMSGYSEVSIETHGELAPGAALIEKPFTIEALARKVRQVLGARQSPGSG